MHWPCPSSPFPLAGPQGDAVTGASHVPPSGSTCLPKAAFGTGVSHLCHCIWHCHRHRHCHLPPVAASHLGWSCPRRVPVRSGGSRGDDGSTPNLRAPPRLLPPACSRLWAGAVAGPGMLSSGGARGVLPARRLPGLRGRSCDGRGRGGSGAASHGEGKVNSCRAVIMRRVGVAGQLRPCPSPTGTICDQAQLCLPYQPFRSDFPTTSPSRRPHFLTARGWRGTAGPARHGTAVLVHLGARHKQRGKAWHGCPSAAWHKHGARPLLLQPLCLGSSMG